MPKRKAADALGDSVDAPRQQRRSTRAKATVNEEPEANNRGGRAAAASAGASSTRRAQPARKARAPGGPEVPPASKAKADKPSSAAAAKAASKAKADKPSSAAAAKGSRKAKAAPAAKASSGRAPSGTAKKQKDQPRKPPARKPPAEPASSNPPKASKAKQKAAKPKTPEDPHKARISRALGGSGNRLFMIQREDERAPGEPQGAMSVFSVLGSKGDVYRVRVGKALSCSCMDCRVRGRVCKHLLFVMLRVCKLPGEDAIVTSGRRSLTVAEANRLLTPAQPADPTALACKAVRREFLRRQGRAFDFDDEDDDEDAAGDAGGASGDGGSRPEGDCAVCYEDMGEGDEATVACGTCGKHVHKECMSKWREHQLKAVGRVTCPWCRSEWGTRAGGGGADAAMRLADIQAAHDGLQV